MQMTNSEILRKYNSSDDKKGMVQILADLNGCDKETIQQILINSGIPESEFVTKKRPGRKKKQTTAKADTRNTAPAGKPNPAEAVAAMPPEDESLPLPFSDDDMGIGDDEYGAGAITGGEGVYDIHDYGSLSAGRYIPPNRYRTAEELLKEPEDMTDKEKERLKRIKAIPESVRDLCKAEVENLRRQVMELEKRRDEIIDFLNGEIE